MSKDRNVVVIIGRLTRDAELSYTNSGAALTKMSIACNDMIPGRNGGPWVDEASFFDCILWGKQGEALNQYLLRGQQISIEGRLKQDRWTDSVSGQNRSKVVIKVSDVQLLGKSNGNAADRTEKAFQTIMHEETEQLKEDLDF